MGDVVVGPDPLAVGEPLERDEADLHPLEAPHHLGRAAAEAGHHVQDVRGDQVEENVDQVVLGLAGVAGYAGWPEISKFRIFMVHFKTVFISDLRL